MTQQVARVKNQDKYFAGLTPTQNQRLDRWMDFRNNKPQREAANLPALDEVDVWETEAEIVSRRVRELLGSYGIPIANPDAEAGADPEDIGLGAVGGLRVGGLGLFYLPGSQGEKGSIVVGQVEGLYKGEDTAHVLEADDRTNISRISVRCWTLVSPLECVKTVTD
jgi:hypothetical protein